MTGFGAVRSWQILDTTLIEGCFLGIFWSLVKWLNQNNEHRKQPSDIELLRTRLLFIGQVLSQLNSRGYLPMKPHASLKLGFCMTCLYVYLCIHHEHHKASYASTNHFKGLDLHLCSCFVGHGNSSQENYPSQPCENSSSTQGAHIQNSRKLSLR